MGSQSEPGKSNTTNTALVTSNTVENHQSKHSQYLPQKNYFVMNPSDSKTSNPFNPGSRELQQSYTEKPQSSICPGHIISPIQQAPEGYICVGRVVESPSKNTPISPSQNGVFFVNETQGVVRTEFPFNFNPRRAANMPSKEKVNRWITNIPFHFNGIDEISVDCYPAVTSYSSSSSDSDPKIDFGDPEAIMEMQTRKVTRYATRLYINEDEPIVRIDEYDDEYYDSDGNLINFNEEDMVHVETSLTNISRRDPEYIIQTTF